MSADDQARERRLLAFALRMPLYFTASGWSVRHAVDISEGARPFDPLVIASGPEWDVVCGRTVRELVLVDGRPVPWDETPDRQRCSWCELVIARREEHRPAQVAEFRHLAPARRLTDS